MQVKSFIITAGVSAVIGAAAILMLPKSSKVYRVADDAAEALKMEAGRVKDMVRK